MRRGERPGGLKRGGPLAHTGPSGLTIRFPGTRQGAFPGQGAGSARLR